MTGLATVGVDVGGTSTRIVVYDAAGGVVGRVVSATPSGPDALVEHLATGIAACVAELPARLAGVGVGIPGVVDGDGTVSMALNVGIERPLQLGRMLAARLGVPVRVENDVNAAALGAHVSLAAAPDTSLAYLSIGTGFAAGLVIGGEIVRGSRGAAGEIGHIRVPGGGDAVCVCGQAGCVEAIASGRALIERMRLSGIAGRAEELWDAAEAGNTAALSIRDDAIAALAWSCQVVLLLLDVDQIVVGGGVGVTLGERLIGPVRAQLSAGERSSPLLYAVGASRRVGAAPAGIELGALGADRSARHAHRAKELG